MEIKEMYAIISIKGNEDKLYKIENPAFIGIDIYKAITSKEDRIWHIVRADVTPNNVLGRYLRYKYPELPQKIKTDDDNTIEGVTIHPEYSNEDYIDCNSSLYVEKVVIDGNRYTYKSYDIADEGETNYIKWIGEITGVSLQRRARINGNVSAGNNMVGVILRNGLYDARFDNINIIGLPIFIPYKQLWENGRNGGFIIKKGKYLLTNELSETGWYRIKKVNPKSIILVPDKREMKVFKI